MKIGRFIKSGPDKKILLVSLQKCGTHLIKNVMTEAGFHGVGVGDGCTMLHFESLKHNEYLWSHFSPSDDVHMALEEGIQPLYVIFNFRDPRDAIVSWFHWLHPKSKKSMHLHIAYMKKVYSHFSDAELMNFFIKNDKFRAVEYNPIEHFRLSRVLYFHPRVLNVRFEDLVGAKGGGSNELQLETIRTIFNYLGIDRIDHQQIADRIYSQDSATFRKGAIGKYKDEMSDEQIKLFNTLHGDIIQQYGYELDW